jgi:hypothetical protein
MNDDRAARRRAERERRKAEDDWDTDPEWRAYITHARVELVPKMAASEMNIALLPDDPAKVDLKLAIEVGLGILLGKPLIICCPLNTVLNDKVLAVADFVVAGDPGDPAVKDELVRAITAIGERIDGEADS